MARVEEAAAVLAAVLVFAAVDAEVAAVGLADGAAAAFAHPASSITIPAAMADSARRRC
ncbi:MAG TPA: hypothetical protein VGE11_05680 [Pseudonocardia sp.]